MFALQLLFLLAHICFSGDNSLQWQFLINWELSTVAVEIRVCRISWIPQSITLIWDHLHLHWPFTSHPSDIHKSQLIGRAISSFCLQTEITHVQLSDFRSFLSPTPFYLKVRLIYEIYNEFNEEFGPKDGEKKWRKKNWKPLAFFRERKYT